MWWGGIQTVLRPVNGSVGRAEPQNTACVPTHRSRPGTSAELQHLLIWPFLIFSPLNAREALINFYFSLLGALSPLTVVLIIVVFGQWERGVLTCLCCLEVLQRIHKANNGTPTRRIYVEAHTAALLVSPVFMLSHHCCILSKYLILFELFLLLMEQLKGEHVCMFHPAE